MNVPPKKKSKFATMLASHSKAIADLQSLPSAIQEIKDLLGNSSQTGVQKQPVDVVDDTVQDLMNDNVQGKVFY